MEDYKEQYKELQKKYDDLLRMYEYVTDPEGYLGQLRFERDLLQKQYDDFCGLTEKDVSSIMKCLYILYGYSVYEMELYKKLRKMKEVMIDARG